MKYSVRYISAEYVYELQPDIVAMLDLGYELITIYGKENRHYAWFKKEIK